MYMELRTTPRPLPTVRDYMLAVIEAINDASSVVSSQIDVRLLLSINRAFGLEAADALINLAIDYRKKYPDLVIGVEVSGNPKVGDLALFNNCLNRARGAGLKTTVHVCEIGGKIEEFNQLLVDHIPDRIGHATFLPNPDNDDEQTSAGRLVKAYKIPIELCLTSNVKTKTVASYSDHHIKRWLRSSHPCCLCTDDAGLFQCTLAGEFELAVTECHLSPSDLIQICRWSIDAAFCSDKDKAKLTDRLEQFLTTTSNTVDAFLEDTLPSPIPR